MYDNRKNNIYTGTSGLVLPLPNRRSFPPEFHDKSRLSIYASLFNSVEINSSFYKVPKGSTVQKWAVEVPDDFRFTFKLWRQITHNKELAFNPLDIDLFMQTIDQAADKKGSLLVQFPPGIGIICIDQLENLLKRIQKANHLQWHIAVEFRNRSWHSQHVYDLMDIYHAAMVLHDMPNSALTLPQQDIDFVYLRFHGPNGGYRGSYTDDFLYEYAMYIKEWHNDGKIVYIYFNNTIGDAVKNLMTLNSYING